MNGKMDCKSLGDTHFVAQWPEFAHNCRYLVYMVYDYEPDGRCLKVLSSWKVFKLGDVAGK